MLNNFDSTVAEIAKYPITKDEIIKRLDNMDTHIDEVIGQLETLISIGEKDNKKFENNKIIKQLNVDAELKAKDNVDVVRKIKNIIMAFKFSKSDIEKELIVKLPNKLDYKALTYRDATILEFINQIDFLISYTTDFCLMCIVVDKTDAMSLIFTKEYMKFNVMYAKYLRFYNREIKAVLKDINKVSTQFINPDMVEENPSMIETVFKETGKFISLPSIKGFIGNPFYHFRMWLADRAHKQYELKKEKIKLLELKLTKLRLDSQEDGVDINKINKQIDYYQSKVDDLTYDIIKYENN